MRKLSKKISMLMVLAMLVSLFSGVVSASAASSWSFYNKTADDSIVAQLKNETYKMESNEFADFDLYKDGKTIDTDVYTVKYESSDADVVWVDAKNGKLRADKAGVAEAGDKAKITAVITNKTTGVTAERWFVIEIADAADYAIVADFADEVVAVGEKLALAATVTLDGKEVEATVAFALDGAAITEFVATEAGDYTIVATATVDGEVVDSAKFVVTVEAPADEIVDAKQKSLNTAEIIFSDATTAAKVVADSSLLDFSYLAGELEVVDLIKKVEAKKDAADTVVVTVYNQFAADTTYKFAYAESSATFVGAKTDAPKYIKVVGGDVPAYEDVELAIKVFTDGDVDITTEELLDGTVTYKSENEDDCIVSNGSIYFFGTGKSTVVTATFDMGWDDETGEEKEDLKAVGTYKSVDKYTYTNLSGYAKGATDKNKDLSYGNGFSISLSDDDQYIKAKLTQTKYDGTAEAMYLSGTEDGIVLLDKDGNDAEEAYRNYDGYELSSTNENVLLVDGDGLLIPLKTGSASIVIKGLVENSDKKDAIGSVAVTVIGARKLSNFVANVSDKMLSAGLESGDVDESFITVTAKDQFGDAYNDVYYTYELVNIDDSYADYLDIEDEAIDSDNNGSNDKIVVKTNEDTADSISTENRIQQLRIKITAEDGNDSSNKKYDEVVFNVKDVSDENPASVQLVLDKTSVDMKLNKANTSDYDVTAKLVMKDSKGYDLGVKEFTLITDTDDAVTGNGEYSIYIQKNAEDHGIDADESTYITFVDDDTNEKYENVKFQPVAVSGSTTQIVKLDKDTYTFSVFKGNGVKAQRQGGVQRLVLSDSTEAIKVVVNNTTIGTGDELEEVAAVLDFYRGGNKITDKITVTDMVTVDTGALADNKLFVKKLTVEVAGSEMSSNGNVDDCYYVETVDVNQLFTID